jgi:hypothetical protein
MHFAVLTAWNNNGTLQNATSMAFSFLNAYAWSPQTQCDIIGAPTPPSITLHLIDNAYFNQNGHYYPPAYGGQGDLCFENSGDYTPVFIVNVPKQSPIQLHQAPSQNPPFLLNIAPVADFAHHGDYHTHNFRARSPDSDFYYTVTQTRTAQGPPAPSASDPNAWLNDSPATKLVVSIWGSWLSFVGFLILVAVFGLAVSKRGFRKAIKERLPRV